MDARVSGFPSGIDRVRMPANKRAGMAQIAGHLCVEEPAATPLRMALRHRPRLACDRQELLVSLLASTRRSSRTPSSHFARDLSVIAQTMANAVASSAQLPEDLPSRQPRRRRARGRSTKKGRRRIRENREGRCLRPASSAQAQTGRPRLWSRHGLWATTRAPRRRKAEGSRSRCGLPFDHKPTSDRLESDRDQHRLAPDHPALANLLVATRRG